MKRILLLSLLLLLTILIVQSEAETILLPDSSWEYTFSDPTGTSSWNTTYGGWSTGLAPFGNMAGAYGPDINGDFSYNTYWPADNSGSLAVAGEQGRDAQAAVQPAGEAPLAVHLAALAHL